jgi:hypothetical protein
MSTGATMMTRRVWLSRLLLAAAVAPVVGPRVAEPVAAGKKKPKVASVSKRTEEQRVRCEIVGGGQLAVLDGPDGGNTTECKGGSLDGLTCINTKSKTTCARQLTNPPSEKPGGGAAEPPSGGNEQPNDDGTHAGGGAGVDPSGGNEQPTDPGSSDGGGSHAGGGGAVDPGGSIEQPSGSGASDGGDVVLYADRRTRPLKARRHGRHQRHGHAGKR